MNKHICIRELQARLELHSCPNIGPQRFELLFQHFGNAQAAMANQSQWQQLGISQHKAQDNTETRRQQQVEQAIRWSEQPGNYILLHDSPAYPALLSEIHSAPRLLFVRGNLAALGSVQLAVVGSRNCSRSNQQTAHSFAKTMAAAGCSITSGLAGGIDTAAHQGALAGNGTTIAVVGTGLNRVYPAGNRQLQEEILANNGTLVSEYFLDTGPIASNFPQRNRIISGLSLGVLVVEAGTSSGSLISARFAMEQNREVFAIPGSIHYPGSRGCHQLIRDGATLVETVDDIISQWQNWLLPTPQQPAQPEPDSSCPVLQILQNRPASTDELSLDLQTGVAQLLPQLTELEISGSIYNKAGLWHYLAPL